MGRRKEYKICEELRKEGFDIVQRTAGSHSPIDIIAIKFSDLPRNKKILFVQSKPDNFPECERKKVLEEIKPLCGWFKCRAIIR